MSDANTKPEWVPWRYGWGERMQLTRSLFIDVYKSTCRDEQFGWSFAGADSKPNIETMDEAKTKAIAFAKSALMLAWTKLESLDSK